MQSVVFWLEFRVSEQVFWVIDAGYLVVVMNNSVFVVVLDLITCFFFELFQFYNSDCE